MDFNSLRTREAFSPSSETANEHTEQVVRGFVHQMNNLLTVFHGYSSILVADKTLDDGTKKCVQEIQDASNRASELLAQVDTVARKPSVHSTQINLHEFIEVQCQSLKTLVAPPSTLVIEVAKDHMLTTDPSILKQVLTAVVTNAAQALDDQGTVMVESTDNGDTVDIRVLDDGRGFADDVREKVFAPFFSQRKDLGCQGLGLAAARHGMIALGGTIAIASKPDEGTCVHLTLPNG